MREETLEEKDSRVDWKYEIKTLPKLQRENRYNGKGRHYQLPGGDWVPSVTNVLSVLDKPALMWWAADVERKMIVDCAHKAARLHGTGDFERMRFLEILESIIPKQQAQYRVSKTATDIGSETHALIEHACKVELKLPSTRPAASEHSERAFAAWELWAEEVDFVPIAMETTVSSERMKAAGALDCFGLQDYPEPGERRHATYDWKSSKRSKTAPDGIYPENLMQVSTYAQMLVELGAAPENTMACIVRLPKSEDDAVFDDEGVVDHKEVLPATRAKYAEGFAKIRDAWGVAKELLK